MTADKIKCISEVLNTSTKMWTILIVSIAAVIVLDVLLTPKEFVGLVSIIFASAISVLFAIIMRDVKKACNFVQ